MTLHDLVSRIFYSKSNIFENSVGLLISLNMCSLMSFVAGS